VEAVDCQEKPAFCWPGAPHGGTARRLALGVLTVFCTLGFAICADGSEVKMKGPNARSGQSAALNESETSSVRIAFLQSIRFYQKWISPIGGERCGFRPSCSAYGYGAIEQQGPIVGIMMTADRLMRCNIWKEPGPDYTLLPNGKLYDPLSKNLLSEK
jgi:putative membrane protein insertion efficiency factor